MAEIVVDGCRVLIVEDQMMIALSMADLLTQMGCQVVATAVRPTEALEAIETQEIDLAILDFDLKGQSCEPVADALAQRAVPFLFSTGSSSAEAPARYRDRPVLIKPYRAADLRRALSDVMTQSRKDPSPP